MTTYIGDHKKRAINLLGTRVRSVGDVTAIVTALVQEIQAAEDALYDVAISRTLDGAFGAQLTLLGDLLGEPRDGLSDRVYRRFVAGALRIRLSSGTIPDIISVVEAITGARDVRYVGQGPRNAYVIYQVDDLTPGDLRNRIRERVNRAAPAGVEIGLTEVVVNDLFLLDETPGFDGPLMGVYF